MPNGTGDNKKRKTREIREQMAHPYITKQHLKPPLSKGGNQSEGERVKAPKPCDWIDKFLYFWAQLFIVFMCLLDTLYRLKKLDFYKNK